MSPRHRVELQQLSKVQQHEGVVAIDLDLQLVASLPMRTEPYHGTSAALAVELDGGATAEDGGTMHGPCVRLASGKEDRAAAPA